MDQIQHVVNVQLRRQKVEKRTVPEDRGAARKVR